MLAEKYRADGIKYAHLDRGDREISLGICSEEERGEGNGTEEDHEAGGKHGRDIVDPGVYCVHFDNLSLRCVPSRLKPIDEERREEGRRAESKCSECNDTSRDQDTYLGGARAQREIGADGPDVAARDSRAPVGADSERRTCCPRL